MPIIEPITLTGRHVTLVPLTHEHDAALTALHDPENLKWMFGQGRVRTLEDRRAFTALLLADDHVTPFAILEPGGDVIGMTTFLSVSVERRRMEIGHTWLAAPFQGTRVNPEMKRMLLAHAFENPCLPPVAPGVMLPGWATAGPCERMQILTDARNARSRRAIEKLGAHAEGVLRRHAPLPGGAFRDTAVYSITPDDWPSVRDGLDARLA